MGPSKSELIHICMPPNEHNRNSSPLGSIQSRLDCIAANIDLAEVMINAQHPIYIHLKNKQQWATVVETKEAGKPVKMRTENGDTFMMKTEGQDTTTGYLTTFMMKTEGQDTTTGYLTLREVIQRSSPTLV